MDRVRITRKYWLIASLAVLLPGLGHWLIGKRDKAIFIASSFLFHITLAYTLLHMVVIEQPLSIAYIIIIVPYHYFYAIFNSLQTAHYKYHYPSVWMLWMSSVLLILASALWVPFDMMYPFKQLVIKLYPIALLVSIACYLLLHPSHIKNGKLYIARVSAALILLNIVVLLILKQIAPIQWSNWIYVLPIIVMIELIVLFLYRLRKLVHSGYSTDLRGLCTAIVFVISSYVVVEYSDYPSQLLESFHAPVIDQVVLDDANGFRYELPPIKVPIDELTSFQLRHLNGHVRVQAGDVQELTIIPVLYVNSPDEQPALDVRAQTSVDVKFNDEQGITIETVMPRYSLNQYPRLNMTVIVPRSARFVKDVSVRVEHGAAVVQDFVASGAIKVESNRAAIHMRNLIGSVNAETKHGSIYMKDIMGNVSAQSKKGDITIIHPTREVAVTALSGDVYVKLNRLNGDMSLTATVGNMQVKLPNGSNYNLHAKVAFGNIVKGSLDEEQIKELSIRNGTGKYEIELYASDYILLQGEIPSIH
ncbi:MULTISPECIES: DUF4097 family beta strand repeat-containing protein [Paenibacillus]|uniref:DUF4097 family beta strand repeat-containing protein n=1 Tax=Paenibacillus TaxID=44249 RepID=UPI00203E4124|nr:DUF4097 family beta strand repeat-containing protein [Paenibacillus camelliae]MCM3634560.1 DUF4097 domain-containing protein [Paenibacillus camelliae]